MGFPNIWNLIPRPKLTHLATYICVSMCVCVCRCMCVCTHMCVGVYIFIHTHSHTRVCIHVCVYIQLIVSHGLLFWIKWSVCISKSQRIFCLISEDGFKFLRIQFCSLVKLQFLAQFSVDQPSHPVIRCFFTPFVPSITKW